MMTTPLLEARGLVSGYGEVTVLRDVDLEVPAGTAVALLGPNGAGKTTLLRTISGFLKPTSGQVVLDGRDILGIKPDKLTSRQGVCLLPEGRGIFPSLSVKENLLVFAPRTNTRATVLDKVVDAFPALGRRMTLNAGNLSGGEQQMLALARVYLTEPSLVLVDEASTGLAPIIVDAVFEFLKGVLRQGAGVLLVEQYVNRALELADYAYVLNHGRIVHAGPAADMDSAELFRRYFAVELES
jgi:branched-chain amino acid transport system ATP-binding protein